MADVLDFGMLPTDDYDKMKSSGYIRKIKLKEDSRAAVQRKVDIYKAELAAAKNNLENVQNDMPATATENDLDNELTKRAELVARIEAKISALEPEQPKLESVKNRAIKIKKAWYENCVINGGMLNENIVERELPEEAKEELPNEEVVEDVNNVAAVNEDVIEPIEEEPITEVEENEEIVVPDEEVPVEEKEESVEDNITSEEIVGEISSAMNDVDIEEPEKEEVSDDLEENVDSQVEEEVVDNPFKREFVFPTVPKVSLSAIKKQDNSDDFVSSDYKLDADIENDISEKMEEAEENMDKPERINARDMNELNDIITNSSDIDEMKAAIESFKQRKLEQERANEEKRAAEEARREEEARLEEVRRKNQEAVEKLKMQNEAIAEDIEYNNKISEEERQKTEELRRQRELQEQLYGELESEILGDDEDYIKK